MQEPAEWDKAEQKILYRALRRLTGQRVFLPGQPGRNAPGPSEGKLTFEWVASSAFNLRAPTPGWEGNLRAGRLGRARVADLFSWLQNHFPEESRALVNEIARAHGAATQLPWEEFIRERGTFGALHIFVPRSRRLSPRVVTLGADEANEIEKVTERVPLHHPFNFNVNGGVGFFIGLQWVRGQWFALRLSHDRLGYSGFIRSMTDGVLLDGPKLIENDQPGLHRFVFIETQETAGLELESLLSADVPVSQTVLLKLMDVLRTMDDRRFKVHRLNAMFVIAEHYGETE